MTEVGDCYNSQTTEVNNHSIHICVLIAYYYDTNFLIAYYCDTTFFESICLSTEELKEIQTRLWVDNRFRFQSFNQQV